MKTCKSETYALSLNAPPRYCLRKAMKDGYCNQHHPKAQKNRDRDADRKAKKKTEQDYVRFKAPQLLKALQQIAKGRKEPQEYAQRMLKKFKLEEK